MKDETFRKVFIKSEEDLPKEGQKCICHLIADDELIETAIFQSVHTKSWFKNVDWYLQPISQPEQEQMDESEMKLFQLDLLKLNRSIKIDDARYYPEESVCNIICQVSKMLHPAISKTETVQPSTEKEEYCTCGNPSKEGNCYFEGDEDLVYQCADCGKVRQFDLDEEDESVEHKSCTSIQPTTEKSKAVEEEYRFTGLNCITRVSKDTITTFDLKEIDQAEESK